MSLHTMPCVSQSRRVTAGRALKRISISAEQMEEEFRTQVPLGFFHRTDAQSRQETLAPPKSVPQNVGPEFHCRTAL